MYLNENIKIGMSNKKVAEPKMCVQKTIGFLNERRLKKKIRDIVNRPIFKITQNKINKIVSIKFDVFLFSKITSSSLKSIAYFDLQKEHSNDKFITQ